MHAYIHTFKMNAVHFFIYSYVPATLTPPLSADFHGKPVTSRDISPLSRSLRRKLNEKSGQVKTAQLFFFFFFNLNFNENTFKKFILTLFIMNEAEKIF